MRTLLFAALIATAPLRAQLTCTAVESSIDGKTSWWHVRVKDSPKATPRIYSIRPGNERKQAIRDCERWLDEKRKEQQKKQKSQSSKK